MYVYIIYFYCGLSTKSLQSRTIYYIRVETTSVESVTILFPPPQKKKKLLLLNFDYLPRKI